MTKKIKSWGLAANLYDALNGYVDDPTARRMGADLDLETLSRSEHFSLPSNGIILDGTLRGLAGVNGIRLPYKSITIAIIALAKTGGSVRQVLICEELETPLYDADQSDVEKLSPCIRVRGYQLNSYGWALYPYESYIPTNGCVSDNNEFNIVCRYASETSISQIHDDYSHLSKSQRDELKSESSGVIARQVLELIQALSCKNIESASAMPARKLPAKHRKKSKRRPLFQVKKLVLIAPIKNGSNTNHSLISNRSPRAHLRRGHIRRLESGNIWVNACSVGDLKNGFISKRYGVTS